MSRRVHRRPFWPWPAGLALVLAAVGGAALCWLWGALARYEAGTPEAAILAAAGRLQTGQAGAREIPGALLPSRFASEEEYLAAAARLVEGLPLDRDSLRFVQPAQTDAPEGARAYTVVEPEGGRTEFWLWPKPGGGWTAWPRVQPLAAVTVSAPGSVALAVNGLPLEEPELAASGPAAGFEALGEEAPRQNTWRLEGLLEQPELAAQSAAGECAVEWQTPLKAQVTVLPGEGDAAALEGFFDRAARIYARYVSADASFDELRGYLAADTEFYRELRGFDSSWYVSHDSTDFEDFSVFGLEALDENTACGTVRFTYVVYKQGLRPRSYPAEYRMYAVRDGQGWKLLDLAVQ